MKYQVCPICSRRVRLIERYPRYLCRICAERTYAPDGREVGFANRSIEGGIVGYYMDNGEPYLATDCSVVGVPCIADEARFGGIVVQAIEPTNTEKVRPVRQSPIDRLIRPWLNEHCEFLWNKWRWGLKDQPDLAKRFSLEHAPEPYIVFAESDSAFRKPLYVLLTNPGDEREEQLREVVLGRREAKCRPVEGRMFYSEAAIKFGSHYLDVLKTRPAGRRNQAMQDLQKKLDRDCIIQFETIPFHSRNLPGKRRLVGEAKKSPLLRDYHRVLHDALSKISVICLSAVATSKSISKTVVTTNPWLAFQAELMGVEVSKPKTLSLARKGRKVSSAFLFQRFGKHIRGFVLTMGSNSFPAEKGRERISRLLNQNSG